MLDTISFPGATPFVADDGGNGRERLLPSSTLVPKDTNPPYQLRDQDGVRLGCFADPRRCVDTAVSQLRTPLTITFHGVPIAKTNRKAGESRADTQARVLREVIAGAVQRNREIGEYKARVLAHAAERVQ